MAITGAAAGSSVTPAASSVLDPVDLVNTPTGYPALEKYPGSVDPMQYDWGWQGTEKSAASIPFYADEPFGACPPEVLQGGGYQDSTWIEGTDNQNWQEWDSNAGLPFSGVSGAVNPDSHAGGHGATFEAQHVVGAEIGSLTRRTMTGQTYNREFAFDPVTGQNVPQPNGRTDLDQQQWHDPDPLGGGGYAPWDKPYAERPIQNNLAYEAQPIMTVDNSIYSPSGQLPDRSQYQQYAAQSYEAPEDPYVGVAVPQGQQASAGNDLDFGLVM
jgi:hypothetical protein